MGNNSVHVWRCHYDTAIVFGAENKWVIYHLFAIVAALKGYLIRENVIQMQYHIFTAVFVFKI